MKKDSLLMGIKNTIAMSLSSMEKTVKGTWLQCKKYLICWIPSVKETVKS